MNLIILIPAFNEESMIQKTIQNIPKKINGITKIQIIVVDDGSKDKTAELAMNAGADKVISHKNNLGVGASFMTGIRTCLSQNADIVVTLDADSQFDSNEISKLIVPILNNELDVVIGSRFLNQKTKVPRYRKRGIKIITSAANFGADLNVSDSQSGFRAYSKNAINVIHPTEEGMSASTEILLKISNNGLSLAEVPITISYEGDASEHNPLSHGISVLVNTLKYI